jgi:hypothetical protein
MPFKNYSAVSLFANNNICNHMVLFLESYHQYLSIFITKEGFITILKRKKIQKVREFLANITNVKTVTSECDI